MIRETIGELGDTRPGAEAGGSKRAMRPVPPPTDLSAWAEAAAHAGQAGQGDPPRLVSHRLGGTSWTPAHPLPTGQAGAQHHLDPAVAPPPKRKRRRRRRWYRRPLVVAPLLVLLVLFGLGGTALLRLEATMSEIRSVSEAPAVVSVSDDVGQPEVTVDTSPAQAALVESGLVTETDDGGGFFGRFQDGASNISDMAGAAAALAGISDSSSGGPINVLVMGVDARPGAPIDVGVKADALMVLNIDPAGGECRMLSIPRDTRAELPGYGPSKVNHALLVGGVPYQLLVIEQLLQIPLDHYMLVDFAAFQQVADVIGGVPVTVPAEITNADGATLFAAGPQTMDGSQALNYARYRDNVDGDVGRIRRQWAILRGLATSASSRDLARDINSLLPAIEDHLRTDLSAEEMTALAQDLDGRCTPDTVDTAVLEGSRQRMDDPILRQSVYFNIVSESEVRAQVEQLLGEPETPPAGSRSAGLAGPTPLARRPGPTPLSAR